MQAAAVVLVMEFQLLIEVLEELAAAAMVDMEVEEQMNLQEMELQILEAVAAVIEIQMTLVDTLVEQVVLEL
jgi:hypothetical protein